MEKAEQLKLDYTICGESVYNTFVLFISSMCRVFNKSMEISQLLLLLFFFFDYVNVHDMWR